MNKCFAGLCALLLVLLAGCEEKAPARTHLALADGSSLDWDSLRGQTVVINYWAQWCKPCVKEIPELNRLAAEQADIRVFGIDHDGSQGEVLAERAARLDIRFPLIVADPAPLLNYPRPNVLPTTLIFRPDGSLLATLHGPQTHDSLLERIRP